MLPVVTLFVVTLVIPFYRRVARMSAYEFLETPLRLPGARLRRAALHRPQPLPHGLHPVPDVRRRPHHDGLGHPPGSSSSPALVTIAYTMVGGIDAVIWTDVLQAVVLLGGGLLCAGLLLFGVDGGPAPGHPGRARRADKFQARRLVARPHAAHRPRDDAVRPLRLRRHLHDRPGLRAALPGRADDTRGPARRVARDRGRCVFTWTLFMLIGTLLYSYYTVHPDQLPAASPPSRPRSSPTSS